MPRSQRETFETIIAPRLPVLFRAAFRLSGNRQDAEDLVQDTCIAACENLPSLEAALNADRWLLRVLYNRFVDAARRNKRSPIAPLNGSDEAAHMASAEPGPEELFGRGESEAAFECAWRKLEDTQRVLLSLRAEGYGLPEIEEITGIGRDVLRARLHRARKSLARHLDGPDLPGQDMPSIGRGQ